MIKEGLKKLCELAKAHLLVTGVIVLGVVFLVWQFGGSALDSIRHARTASSVDQTQAQADREKKTADSDLKTAGDERIERRVEDGTRERVITPEIERAARAVAEARQRTEKATRDYEATQTGTTRSALDDALLHERNCSELAELYPGTKFEGCH